MRSHIVRRGECLSLLATRYGFRDYRTIYDHPANAALKKKRPNPNLIHPGDEVKIPDLAQRTENAETGQTHTFIVKLPTKKLVLHLRDGAGGAIADVDYLLVVEDVYYEGRTDGSGKLEHQVPVDAQRGTVWAGGMKYELGIGDLNPMRDTPDGGASGAHGRLMNLGVHADAPAEGDALDPHSLAVFQLLHGLEPSGELDAATRHALEKEHAS